MKIMFVSLGCDKNLVDTEKMMGILRRDHYELTDDETAADVIIINSCCFIGPAKEESIDTILEMAKQKETGSCKALIVTGCLAQRYREEVLSELPEVDAVVGTTAYDSIASVVAGVLEDSGLKGAGHAAFCDIDRLPPIKGNRIVTTGGHYAYLKIAEGCSKHCTYCVIPNVRGRYRSIPEEDLLAEARELAAQGVKELIVVAQETTVYGLDIYGEKRLHVLLKKLAAIPGIEWVRVEYCYPEELYQELVDTIRDEEKICRYLDIPIQHASDAVLKKMGRRTTQADLRRIIDWLRQELPGVALRTTLISGFPQETEEDHEELMGFVEEMGFDRLGVFAYSQEEDTPAARLPGQIPEEVKERRRDEIMSLQQDISYERSQGFIGSTMKVMIEGRLPEEDVYVGRTYRDAPDVDGYIFIKSDRPLITGDFVTAKVTGADEYDLTGELTDEPAE
jgi:ribosomal protein S12 methylthiotransferase